MDINSLDRFLTAQEHVFDLALGEIRRGHKRSHWMWYIFPQLRSLGKSQRSFVYGIADLDEAKRYLAHPILGCRLTEISNILLSVRGKSSVEILGEIDSQKLHSSMTLFAAISDEGSVFHKVIDMYFDGEYDSKTMEILKLN